MTLDPSREVDRETTADLERIARELPAIPTEFAELRQLLSTIRAPVAPSLKSAREAPLPTAFGGLEALSLVGDRGIGTDPGSIFGVEQPHFYGPTNLLNNPRLESFPATGTVGTVPTTLAYGKWIAQRFVNAGSFSSDPTIDNLYSVGSPSNPFNSAVLELNGQAAASSNLDVYLWQVITAGGVSTGYSHLVAACLVAGYSSPEPNTLVKTATLQIVRDSDGVVLAQSAPHDLLSSDWSEHGHRLMVAVANPLVNVRWRLKIHIETSAAGTGVLFMAFGEPLAHFGWTDKPEAYAPIIARWIPAALDNWGSGLADTPILEIRGGRIRWGSGGAAGGDLGLTRFAASHLRVGNEFGADSVIVEIAGADAGNEGGELQLAGSAANVLWAIDNFAGRLRMHSAGIAEFDLDTNRLYIDSGRIDLGANLVLERIVDGGLGVNSGGGAFDTRVIIRSTAGRRSTLDFAVTGDTQERLWLSGDATLAGIEFGPGGAGARDIRIARSGAETLVVSDGAGGSLTRFAVVGNFDISGNVGFYNTAATTKQTVTGSRGGNAALASLLTGLSNIGLITNSSTA